MKQSVHLVHKGTQEYLSCLEAMRQRVTEIAISHQHEIWLVDHPSVFTLGQTGERKHLLATGDIPVVQSNRGGQVSWHGPGQIVIYVLWYLPALRLNIRSLVTLLENSVIHLLAEFGISAQASADAPGVYVDDAKIASLGLRISRSVSYHGLSFNHDCSLEPFNRINTCGYPGLEVTRLINLCNALERNTIALKLCHNIASNAGLIVKQKEANDNGNPD